jgi:AraC-like DNA-binding protein
VAENRKEEVFEQFLRVLSETFRKERSVNYYANKLFLTSKHLSRVVKEISGKTAGEWIDDFVILEAKALLRSSEKSIQEISEALHFANQSFFGKYFKHHTGMSPKEYRRQ